MTRTTRAHSPQNKEWNKIVLLTAKRCLLRKWNEKKPPTIREIQANLTRLFNMDYLTATFATEREQNNFQRRWQPYLRVCMDKQDNINTFAYEQTGQDSGTQIRRYWKKEQSLSTILANWKGRPTINKTINRPLPHVFLPPGYLSSRTEPFFCLFALIPSPWFTQKPTVQRKSGPVGGVCTLYCLDLICFDFKCFEMFWAVLS